MRSVASRCLQDGAVLPPGAVMPLATLPYISFCVQCLIICGSRCCFLTIYTIICLKSVPVRKLQVAILALSPREMSHTDRILPRYILSRVRVPVRSRIFLYAKKPQTRLARMLCISSRVWIRSAAR